jgi:hypothetical protein
MTEHTAIRDIRVADIRAGRLGQLRDEPRRPVS